MIDIRIPDSIDPAWNPMSGERPKMFCNGCGAQLPFAGYGDDVSHSLLDCLQELRDQIRILRGETND